MAHKIKTTPRPHVNADGTKSATKVDYYVTHRHRKTKKLVGIFTSKKEAAKAEAQERYITFGAEK